MSEIINKSEVRQRTIISEIFSEEVSSKITRLENSISKMITQFEDVKNGNSEDSALRVTTDSEASDLALANVNLPKEELYPYLCGDLSDKLNIRPYDVQKMIQKFKLRNDDIYHLSIKSGKTGEVQKWSEATYERLKEALDSGEYTCPTLS